MFFRLQVMSGGGGSVEVQGVERAFKKWSLIAKQLTGSRSRSRDREFKKQKWIFVSKNI